MAFYESNGVIQIPPLLKENGGEDNPRLSETARGLSATTEELKFETEITLFCTRIVRNHRKTIAPLKFALFFLTLFVLRQDAQQ